MTIRGFLYGFFAVLVIVVMNVAIYQKEQLKQSGDTVYLKLAPVDPRSLLQGDYMALNYEVAIEAQKNHRKDDLSSVVVVLKIDAQKIGHFARFYHGEALAANERRLPISKDVEYDVARVYVKPDRFHFQEGTAKIYEQAVYGVFKFPNNGGRPLLIGLADDSLQTLSVDKQ